MIKTITFTTAKLENEKSDCLLILLCFFVYFKKSKSSFRHNSVHIQNIPKINIKNLLPDLILSLTTTAGHCGLCGRPIART